MILLFVILLVYMNEPKCAFTLIELLIVVAIIGILAAIAVPNFVNARMRALVSRTYADLKNCATAIEQYGLDQGRYPYYNNPVDEVGALSGAAVTYLPIWLTTPVPYFSQLPLDPFPPSYLAESEKGNTTKPYKYIHGYDQVYKNQQFVGSHIRYHFQNFSKETRQSIMWQVWSLGPDRVVAHDGLSYDVSNGLFSYGDISRFGP